MFAIACSRQSTPPPTPAALLQAISPADPARYPAQHEGKHWANPYLVVRPQNIALLTSVNPNEEQILKPEEVLNTLAHFPASAWPYGRVVAIFLDDKPGSSEADKTALRRERGIVEGDLRSAAVAIYWINAAQ